MSPFLNISMPMKEKFSKAQLAALVAEQAQDAGSTCVFPEKITPRKPEKPSSITEREYMQLILELGVLTCGQIAREMKASTACINQHRSNAHKKLGPQFSAKWKKFSKTFKALHLSLFSDLEFVPSSFDNDDKDDSAFPSFDGGSE